MAPFLNKNINEKNSIKYILISVFGIGPFSAQGFCRDLGVSSSLNFQNLSVKQKTRLADSINQDQIILKQEDLKKQVFLNLQLLEQIRAYRGKRHSLGLPSRGQRTRTNRKTAKRLNKLFL